MQKQTETPTEAARRLCPRWMDPEHNANYRDVLSALKAQRESMRVYLSEAVELAEYLVESMDYIGTGSGQLAARAAKKEYDDHCSTVRRLKLIGAVVENDGRDSDDLAV